jgi:hypothetical protein
MVALDSLDSLDSTDSFYSNTKKVEVGVCAPGRAGSSRPRIFLSMKKPKQPVRRWAYAIWMNYHLGAVLMTLPRDGEKLEALITEHGELTVVLAWNEFVIGGEGRWYHTASVTHVDEFTTKSGKKMIIEKEDDSAVTRFPLAAFLAVPDGCVVAAQNEMQKPNWKERNKRVLALVTKNPSQR